MEAPVPLSFSEKRDRLRLIRTPTIGPVAFRALMERYGTAAKALGALPHLSRRKPVTLPPLAAVEAEMEACETACIHLIADCEPDYPEWLRALNPPPPMISVRGQVDILHRPCIAIVGSRNASALGQRFAEQTARELGEAGVTVVSGLARGIDRAAHTGALPYGTAAVLGGGPDHVYPRQNADLYETMSETGAIISESPIGYRATARDFPRRNRIISGLSRGVLVVEAAERSGTLITARYALEQNREVMAVPGSPLDPRAKGCNTLLRQGAMLVENTEDILSVIRTETPPEIMEPLSDLFDVPVSERETVPQDSAAERLRAVLSVVPTARDHVIRAAGLPAGAGAAALLELELTGEIFSEPDGRVALK